MGQEEFASVWQANLRSYARKRQVGYPMSPRTLVLGLKNSVYWTLKRNETRDQAPSSKRPSLSKLRPQKPAERVQDHRQRDHLDLGLTERPADAHRSGPRLEGGQQPIQ